MLSLLMSRSKLIEMKGGLAGRPKVSLVSSTLASNACAKSFKFSVMAVSLTYDISSGF